MLERAEKGSESPLHASRSLMTNRRGKIQREGHLFNKDDHVHLHAFSSTEAPQTEQLLENVNVNFQVLVDTYSKKNNLAAEHRQMV